MLALSWPGRPRTITLKVAFGFAVALFISAVGTNAFLLLPASAVPLSTRPIAATVRSARVRPRSRMRESPPLPPVPQRALKRVPMLPLCRTFLLIPPSGGPQFCEEGAPVPRDVCPPSGGGLASSPVRGTPGYAAEMQEWWVRSLLVLQAPRAVFVALRDDSGEAASDRAEPVLAIVLLAGIASVLSTTTAAHLLDDHAYDGLLVAVWTFLAGGLYGAVAYWFFGALLHGAVKALGSQGSYRRTRHMLAFAAVPLVLSLVVWPLKLALWGEDLFRSGGSDHGPGVTALAVVELGFLVWTVALLVVGIRSVHGWTWPRTGAAL